MNLAALAELHRSHRLAIVQANAGLARFNASIGSDTRHLAAMRQGIADCRAVMARADCSLADRPPRGAKPIPVAGEP